MREDVSPKILERRPREVFVWLYFFSCMCCSERRLLVVRAPAVRDGKEGKERKGKVEM